MIAELNDKDMESAARVNKEWNVKVVDSRKEKEIPNINKFIKYLVSFKPDLFECYVDELELTIRDFLASKSLLEIKISKEKNVDKLKDILIKNPSKTFSIVEGMPFRDILWAANIYRSFEYYKFLNYHPQNHSVATHISKCGFFEKSIEIAQKMEKKNYDIALTNISIELANRGYILKAIEIAKVLEKHVHPALTEAAFKHIIKVLEKNGRVEKISEIAVYTIEKDLKHAILLEICEAYIRMEAVDKAEQLAPKVNHWRIRVGL